MQAPTLLIVGGRDYPVIDLNRQALDQLGTATKHLMIVPGATHPLRSRGRWSRWPNSPATGSRAIFPGREEDMTYRDRTEAGRVLAERLTAYTDRSDVLVLALPRGGVPVAFEVAQALHAPLDVFLASQTRRARS